MVVGTLRLQAPRDLLVGSSPSSLGPTITIITISPESVTYTATQQIKNILIRDYNVISIIPCASPLLLGTGGEKRLDRLLCLGDAVSDDVITAVAKRVKVEVEEVQVMRDVQVAEILDLIVLDVVEAMVEHQLVRRSAALLHECPHLPFLFSQSEADLAHSFSGHPIGKSRVLLVMDSVGVLQGLIDGSSFVSALVSPLRFFPPAALWIAGVCHWQAQAGWIRLYDHGIFAKGLLTKGAFVDCCRVALTMDHSHAFSAELSLQVNVMIEPQIMRRGACPH